MEEVGEPGVNPVNEKAMERQKVRLKEVLRELAMMTTVHGVANIVSATQTYKKVLWISLWLLTFGALCLQIFKLSTYFVSLPKQTSIDLKFGALKYPAISFCNINPVKKTHLGNLSDKALEYWLANSEMEMKESTTASRSIIVNKSNPDFHFLERFEKYGVAQKEWDLTESIPNNAFLVRNMVVAHSMNEITESEMLRVGHTIDDMLLHCSINSRRCNSSDFVHFKSSQFGNCYTMQSNRFVATVPGPAYGLTLMLNLDRNEYISPYSSGYGLKLLVHEQGTYPFIEEQGVTLAPDWTFISLKQKNIKRREYPQGNCGKYLEYKTKYGIEYSRMACEQICLITLTKDICGCVTGFVSIDKSIVTNSTATCKENYVICSLMVLEAQVRGSLPCPCTNPCSELHFSTTVSSLSWPHEEYLKRELIPLMCMKGRDLKIKEATGYNCSEIRASNGDLPLNMNKLRGNFLKLDLYFKELSYEHIEELSAYDSVQFLSDIGGTVGLFVGASVLSGVELIQLLVECCRYILFRLRNKR